MLSGCPPLELLPGPASTITMTCHWVRTGSRMSVCWCSRLAIYFYGGLSLCRENATVVTLFRKKAVLGRVRKQCREIRISSCPNQRVSFHTSNLLSKLRLTCVLSEGHYSKILGFMGCFSHKYSLLVAKLHSMNKAIWAFLVIKRIRFSSKSLEIIINQFEIDAVG